MTKVLKQAITVAFSFIMLIVFIAAFMFSNPSLAWFAKNENVSANGLSASVKVSPNLIIATNAEDIAQGKLSFGVDFKGRQGSNMIAVTHDENVPSTFLKYLTNHYAVDHVTGNAVNGATLEFADVPEENNEAYFIDYTVYIASAFEELEITALSASITIPYAVDDDHPYFNAASVDFYVNEVSLDGYRGTTSVADSIEKSVNLFPDGGTVPFNEDGHIKVIMRCYFDGALQDENGNAYVNSFYVKQEGVVIGVEFFAIEKVVNS